MADLIVTSGDIAAELLRAAGIQGEILPWRDVLHEGPVPVTPDLESLSVIRAAFLADAFDRPHATVAAELRRRDRTLIDRDPDGVLSLWFEHDLCDQLQLLQLLDFVHREVGARPVFLVQADDYLGRQTPATIRRFEDRKTQVSAKMTALAVAAFAAFRAPSPGKLATLLDRDLSALPHLSAAIRRLLEELPDCRTGLGRSQHQALRLIAADKLPPKRLFGASQALEDAMFMGDWSFWRCMEEMAFNAVPLIRGLPCRFRTFLDDRRRRQYLDAELSLTESGRAVLAGDADHAALNRIDRWQGGTRLAEGSLWRWDRETGALVPPA